MMKLFKNDVRQRIKLTIRYGKANRKYDGKYKIGTTTATPITKHICDKLIWMWILIDVNTTFRFESAFH